MMMRTVVVTLITVLVGATVACAGMFLGPEARFESIGIVDNPRFDSGGATYASNWRRLPGSFRYLRQRDAQGEHSLFFQLHEDGDGGVIQRVDLPPQRRISLQILATCWSVGDCGVVASVVRIADGEVLAEVAVNGIERGVMAQNLFTGAGGPAELTIRLVGARGGQALIDWVAFGPPVEVPKVRTPDFSARDLLLAPGEGLRISANFEPTLLPHAAVMLQEAIEDITGQQTRRSGAEVLITVDEPQADDWPARESYRLRVGPDAVQIEAPAEQGAVWAMMSLMDLLRSEPGGGVRILAVDVQDEPALPWRISSVPPGETPVNSARIMARLKLNMATVGDDLSEVGALMFESRVRAVQQLGILPLMHGSPETVDDPRAAIFATMERFDPVGFVFTVRGEPLELDRTDPTLAAAAEAAAESVVIVTAFAYLGRDEEGASLYRALPAAEMEQWPSDVVALLLPPSYSEEAAQQIAAAEANGVRYLIYDSWQLDGVDAALRARERSDLCLGVVIGTFYEHQQRAADGAWSGLPAGGQ